MQAPGKYEITEGAGSSWITNSDEALTFVANGDISKFVGIEVDGECSANFEIKEPGADAGGNSNTVKTGDTSNMLVWISLLATSILTAMILLIDKNKKIQNLILNKYK